MAPERKTVVNGHKIEEFYWAGKMIVYVDNRLISDSYDAALRKLAAGKEISFK